MLAAEEMILLSNVIKSLSTINEQRRVLPAKPFAPPEPDQTNEEEELETAIDEQKRIKKELEAELQHIEQQIADLQQEIAEQRQAAKAEIEAWWEEQHKRLNDERQTVLHQAKADGFQSGYQQGYEQIQQELAAKLGQIEDILRAAYEEKEAVIQSAEPFLLALSVEVAKKIVQAELETEEEQHVNIVRNALRKVKDSGQVVLEVDPMQYELYRSQQEELAQYLETGATLQIIPKQQLHASGGCMIHTANGSFDVTVDSQLEEIKRKLLEYYEESAVENE